MTTGEAASSESVLCEEKVESTAAKEAKLDEERLNNLELPVLEISSTLKNLAEMF